MATDDLSRLMGWLDAAGLPASLAAARHLQDTSWSGKGLTQVEWEVIKIWEADCPTQCWTPIERRTL